MDISASDDVVSLIPLDKSFLREAASLYNSSDMCFATGYTEPVTKEQLAPYLEHFNSCDNEFISGIFIRSYSGIPKFVGIVSGMMKGNELWIKLLGVLPAFRRKGIGSRTIGLIFQYFKEIFHSTGVFVSVAEKNAQGLCFWTKQGFSEAGSLYKELFGENLKYKVVIMNKRL
jgi:GNAT superfamily N-acetyltransferase